MPADRSYGPDHPHHVWSPLPAREPLRWPSGKPLAMSVVILAEFFELDPPEGAVTSAWLAGGLGPRPFPNYARMTHREYGHRVGIFRMLDVLHSHGLRPAVAIDALTAENYPWLVDHLKQRGTEFLAHGIAVTRMISSRMSEQQERDYIAQTLDRLAAALGERPVGWMGPEQGESERTPQLLAEAGLDYVSDWSNDEQPYPMTVPRGSLTSMPTMVEYDDAFALSRRQMTLSSYQAMLTAGIDRLALDGKDAARYLQWIVRPWLTGQPFRIGVLDEVVAHAAALETVWFAAPGEIAAAYTAASGQPAARP